jgi:hypothetical protein
LILAGPASGNRGELGLASTYERRNRSLPLAFSRLRAALGAISAFMLVLARVVDDPKAPI